jgi:UDP-N-acetylmuramyl pentapeptide synthase
MRELGAVSEAEHKAVVALVEKLKVNARFVGPEFKAIHAEALSTAEDLSTELKKQAINGHLVLIKGSRGIKLETVVPQL